MLTVIQNANSTTTTVSHDANSTMKDQRTFDGDINLLKHIYELVDKVESTSHFEDENLFYSTCLRGKFGSSNSNFEAEKVLLSTK